MTDLYANELSTYGQNNLISIDGRQGLWASQTGSMPLVTDFATYTYNGYCAGWKFTYSTGYSSVFYIFDDSSIEAPLAETTY